MAGAGMKDIKRRIKSVESTMKITKAMELVASSKLRKAKERAENVRPFATLLYDTICDVATHSIDLQSPFTTPRKVSTSGFLVIAGDRGLAGGYNANVLRYAEEMMKDKDDVVIIPLGKRVAEYFVRRGYEVKKTPFEAVEGIDFDSAFELSDILTELFVDGTIDELFVVYTNFVSMMAQEPDMRKLLPMNFDDQPATTPEKPRLSSYTTFDPSPEEVLRQIVPQYVGGILYGAVAESFASEQAARRMAMEAATDNAEEMIETLSLVYNRARQGAITQEITEIVGGANALS